MSMKEALLAEWDQEMAGTRRALASIPDGKFDWAPHAKSMKLGRLGEHVATMGMWATQICTSDVFDFATSARPPLPTTTAEILATHDQWSAQGRAALVALDESKLTGHWALKNGEHVVFSRPRADVLRSFVMNHMIHHRAQLTVYLRLLDVKVPGLYGPTADDR